ncbi:glycoside hydrolase family 2 protein [Annulohypoxylon maeteangense]|uniref:glycoside hydrolase family 2 protein n=1 Tax=Annulohypoxylon maeteangense TaxID=1927788 RepID=UPI0020085D85|nr:glycoside hydrolase family 2 protein [Annulohypoxylon maeteangense]KAI0882571.1 glycoside hydrolase family 2 protein [Annulohypoxylon maeteangense]
MMSLVRTVYNACGLLSVGLVLLGSLQGAEAGVVRKLPDGYHKAQAGRERISINADWRFSRFESNPDSLSYNVLKKWILPTGNDFIVNGVKYDRPSGDAPGSNVSYVQASFDDSDWESVNVPHDWAIKGPFHAPNIPNSMGALPINGVGWYRRNLIIEPSDNGKSIFLDIDGAMSNSAIWINGQLVGGWPYGYNSFRLDLTPYVKTGENLLAIRIDNPLNFSRWYPGAGLYRNVWLVKVDPTHFSQYGTYITTPAVSAESADVDLTVEIENLRNSSRQVEVTTDVYVFDAKTGRAAANAIATFPQATASVAAASKQTVNASVTIANPKLWGPKPDQEPNLYIAVTTLRADGAIIDTYETRFGVRSITYDGNTGISVNGKRVYIQGTNNHHDQGSIGAAFHLRAAERQLEMLQEMGCNALRMSHNPPAAELLDLADEFGFLVLDEIFDVWKQQKISDDYHVYFNEWHEQDLRNFIRRDRNHPSIMAFSIGNEIVEQSSSSGGATARELVKIVKEEDPIRHVGAGINNAQAGSEFATALDIPGLNYQGEGRGTSFSSAYPPYHAAYPDKVLWSTESSSGVSSRGTYLFPVTSANSSTVQNGNGQDPNTLFVSAYELYAVSWGSSPDKVFGMQDKFSYAAGEFVWTGWDYLGEPTPFDTKARSSYFGIIDLAGFKKDRFFLYQARWRPDFPMAHILPHWTWPDRVGEVTPVHVFSSADEAELFVNGKSAGKLQRQPSNYRFRWDKVTYSPGELHVVTYKNGSQWAEETVKTAGDAAKLTLSADRTTIQGDDLSFVTVTVVDEAGTTAPEATNAITFSITGPAEIVSTDNGNPADFTAFPSLTRKAFAGLALAVVRSKPGAPGEITVRAQADGLEGAEIVLRAQ